MKRAATISVLTLALLVASLARADWRQAGGLNGGPVDTWIADAGYFSVHTKGTAAYRMFDDGGVGGVVPAGSVAVATSAARCTAIVNGLLRVIVGSGSVEEGQLPHTDPDNISTVGCRASESLTAYGYGLEVLNSLNRQLIADAGTFGADWRSLDAGGNVPVSATVISARTVFGHDYSLTPRSNVVGTYFMVDGLLAVPFKAALPSPERSEIWGTRDGGVRAVVVGGDGGQLLTLQSDGSIAAENFTLPPDAGSFSFHGATLSELEGDQYGAGFGMLLVESASSQVQGLWSAIPDPNNVGRYWVRSSVQPPPPSAGVYDSVRCLSARYCVLGASGSTGANQLAVYQNANSPQVAPPAFVLREEDTATQVLTLGAQDLDGDPVFLTWAPDPSSTTYFNSLGPDPTVHDGTTYLGSIKNRNSALCGQLQAVIPVDVVGSDGLKSTTASGSITIQHTPPGPLTADQTTFLQAGTPAATQTYGYVSNGCSGLTAEISPLTSATVALSGSSLTVTYAPPRIWCDATPGSGTQQFQVQVADGPAKSLPALATFVVLPWGEPETPFDAGRVAFQDAGTAVTYAPDATHLCGDAGTFPGVDTRWTWSASGSGFTPAVLEADGGQLPQGGGISPTATVVVPDCQSGRIDFQATNTTRMDGGLTSPPSPLTVNVATVLQPLAGALSISAVPDDAGVSGVVDLAPPVQCPQNRSFGGTVELYRASDGGLISSGTLSGLPATYALPAPGACGGGAFYVTASVTDQTGTVGPGRQDVTLPVLVPGFASVTVPDFLITCGDVARTQATATVDSSQCPSEQVDWSSSGAVAIAPGATGFTPNLETVSSDFGGLIGMPVIVTATGTAETGSASMTAAPALVTAAPFVRVVYRTDTAVASESRVLGVEVQLTNTTACDVSGVEWHETLGGMQLIEGSLTGPDGGIDPVPDGGELVVPGLSLPAGQPVTLRYSARPTLFGDPSPSGVATLRAVRISDPSGLVAGQRTCGCQTASGGGTALIGLLAAALLRRRRTARAVRARS